MSDLTVIYYTANYLDETNPYFLENTKKQLLKAIGDLPLISVSQKPIVFGKNICVGNIGRSHLNIYRQILTGCREAKTRYVAMAEDDILYSYEHFHSGRPKTNHFLYDMNKWSIFTWSKPPIFSYRHRKIVNSLIAERKMLVEALEERFAKFPDEKKIPLSRWGDPGRYEDKLGVTVRLTQEFACPGVSNIVFSHENAFGYESRGERKRLGEPRAIEVPHWGRAEEVMKLFRNGS